MALVYSTPFQRKAQPSRRRKRGQEPTEELRPPGGYPMASVNHWRHPMALVYSTPFQRKAQPSRRPKLADVLAAVDDRPVLRCLRTYRPVGRRGHPLRALFRAHLASYALGLNSTNDIIRRLHEDAVLRRVCGFRGRLPHRTTFNRFAARLALHTDVVEQCLAEVTAQLRGSLPDLGAQVAVDSTAIDAYGNPRNRPSDPDAAWGVKTSTRGANATEHHYGYKLHMAADANHGLPLAMLVLPANRSDSPELPVVTDKARGLHPWMRITAVIADRGYDAEANFRHIMQAGADPVILTKQLPKGHRRQGIYDHKGVPSCVGQKPMEYVRSDPELGHLFRCAGCELAGKPGHSNCKDEVWEHPSHNPRLGGAVRMDSPEWWELYGKRQTIEGTFKSLKQSLRLNKHAYRGLPKVGLHCLMSILVYQATALANVRAGAGPSPRWMVARVA